MNTNGIFDRVSYRLCIAVFLYTQMFITYIVPFPYSDTYHMIYLFMLHRISTPLVMMTK